MRSAFVFFAYLLVNVANGARQTNVDMLGTDFQMMCC